MLGKPSNSLRIIPFGDVDNLPGVDVDEQRNIVLAALGRRLIDGNAPQVREVHARHSCLNVVLDEAPQALVMLPDQARHSSDRHVLDEGHDKRFEQKREAGSGSCPRHVDKAHAPDRTDNASDARMQKGLVLEEIELAPGLLDGVVNRAVGLTAIRALKAATNLEIDLDVELLPLGV